MNSARGLVGILVALLSIPPSGAQSARALADDKAAALVKQLTLDEKVDQLLNMAPAIPRLGIPAYNWWTESLHGAIGPIPTTNFPEPIGLAATFDDALLQEVAAAISVEVRASACARPQARQRLGPSAPGSTPGRRTSISSAIRAGDADRKPTAKIRSWRRAWASPTFAACRGRIRTGRT